jgi:penicillin-binding protein 1C
VVQTTIDRNLQKAVADLAKLHLAELPTSSSDLAAAVIVLDTATGECVAAVNTGPAAGELDLTHRRRSTGSTLKPFIYALAFEEGVCGQETLLNDGQVSFAGYTPRNFDRAFRGQLPAREALAQSRNIPAMDLLSRVGVPRTSRLLSDLGLRQANDPDRYGLTLAVGGAAASPIEIAGAFATLARGGRHLPPRLTTDPIAPPARLISSKACAQVIQALSDITRTMRIAPAAAKLGVAWKTGTSSDQRDAWCAAATASHTVVVWIGKPASNGDAVLIGAEAAAPLALAVIVAVDGNSSPAPAEITSAPADQELAPARSHRFAIIAPQPRQEIVIDPTLPPESQQVALRVDQPTPEDVYWFVDAEPLGPASQSPQWWQPTPGTHTLRATTASGEASTVRVVVNVPESPAR